MSWADVTARTGPADWTDEVSLGEALGWSVVDGGAELVADGEADPVLDGRLGVVVPLVGAGALAVGPDEGATLDGVVDGVGEALGDDPVAELPSRMVAQTVCSSVAAAWAAVVRAASRCWSAETAFCSAVILLRSMVLFGVPLCWCDEEEPDGLPEFEVVGWVEPEVVECVDPEVVEWVEPDVVGCVPPVDVPPEPPVDAAGDVSAVGLAVVLVGVVAAVFVAVDDEVLVPSSASWSSLLTEARSALAWVTARSSPVVPMLASFCPALTC